MKIISTNVHGALDYLTGLLFMTMPWVLDFKQVVPATWLFLIAGMTVLLMSLFTDYERGMFRGLSMQMHLRFDLVMGLFLAASPWVSGFADQTYLPALLSGIFQVAVALATSSKTAERSEPETSAPIDIK